MKIDTKKMTTLALLVSVAMILSYIESLVSAFVAVPGVKLGLSNIATVFALYTLGWPSAITVSLVRVLLSALLFGNIPSLIFSIAGAALALASMIPLSRLNLFTSIGVSVVGAVCHNIGQVLAAIIVMKTSGIAYYLIPLLFSGTISGIVIGIVSGILVERIKKYL